MEKPMGCLRRGVVALMAVGTIFAPGCGSGLPDPVDPTAPAALLDPSQPRTPPLVHVTPSGVQPQVSHVDHPVTLTFVNEDTVAHDFAPAPELGYGPPCAQISQVGRLEPGQSGTALFTTLGELCVYHDAAQPGARPFQGLIVVH